MNNHRLIIESGKQTTISSVAYAIAGALSDYACPYDEVFSNTNGALLPVQSKDIRYPVEKMVCLWNLAANKCEEGLLGVKAAEHFSHTSFYALDFSLFASANLVEVFRKFDRFKSVISESIVTSLDFDDKVMRLCFSANGPIKTPYAMDAGITYLHNISRNLNPRSGIRPARIILPLRKDLDRQLFDDYFDCEIVFAEDQGAIEISLDDAFRDLDTGDAFLSHYHDLLLKNYINEFSSSASLSDKIAKLIANNLGVTEPRIEVVAARFHVSARSLQRRLEAEHTSFTSIVEQTRISLAKAMLNNPDQSVTDVALALGYASSSTFSRAFRSWTSLSPREFRKQQFS